MSDLGWGILASLGAIAIVIVVVTCIVVIVLVVKLVKKHKQVHLPEVPVSAKVSYYGAIIYTLSPVDLLPDPILLDDIGVLVAALLHVGQVVKKIYGHTTAYRELP